MSNCSYFVLDNTPNSDYISKLYPGRRPNPAPLIDIVNKTIPMPANYSGPPDAGSPQPTLYARIGLWSN
jgi:hypothetical protein